MATLPFVIPWKKGIIPYIIEHQNRRGILDAIEEVQRGKTPVRFVRRTDEEDYVIFIEGNQNIVLNPRWAPPYPTSDVLGFCAGKNTVILKQDPWLALHEISHVLGLIHEQQRSDRAKFVSIPEDDKDPNWILLAESVNHNLDYDGSSVTHYGLDWQGRKVKWLFKENPGQQWKNLSKKDIESIKLLYI